MIRRFLEPVDGFHVVLRDAQAEVIGNTEMVFCIRIALRCGFAEPGVGLSEVLRDAVAEGIGNTEMVFCHRITLRCGFAVPGIGLSVVLRDAQAVLIVITEIVFCRRIALRRGFAVPGVGLSIVLRDAMAELIGKTEIEFCGWVSSISQGFLLLKGQSPGQTGKTEQAQGERSGNSFYETILFALRRPVSLASLCAWILSARREVSPQLLRQILCPQIRW